MFDSKFAEVDLFEDIQATSELSSGSACLINMIAQRREEETSVEEFNQLYQKQVRMIQIINISRMNPNPTFSQAITEFIWKALHMWPGLQVSLCQLSESSPPPEGSPIAPLNFRVMSNQEFIMAITKNLHDYILEHDVKEDHIADYLIDVLAILNSEEENDHAINTMSRQLIALINQVPDGNYEKLEHIRFVYETLKGKDLGHQVLAEHNESESQGEEEDNDDYSDEDEEGEQKGEMVEEKEKGENMKDEAPKLIESKGEMEEEDGWVIVRSNKKNRK